MRVVFGPEAVKIACQWWARFGEWPPSMIRLLRGVPVPESIQSKAREARVKELADQAIRDSRPSGLLPEEEEVPQVVHAEIGETKRWEPDLTKTCRSCGQKHLTDLCGSG